MYKFSIQEEEIDVLTRDEFLLLDDQEKEEYIVGRLHLNDDGISWVEKVIRLNESGEDWMDEIWDQCISTLYPDKYREIKKEAPEDKDQQLDLIYDLIDELEDPDWNQTRLFFINKVYYSDYLYDLIIEAAQNETR